MGLSVFTLFRRRRAICNLCCFHSLKTMRYWTIRTRIIFVRPLIQGSSKSLVFCLLTLLGWNVDGFLNSEQGDRDVAPQTGRSEGQKFLLWWAAWLHTCTTKVWTAYHSFEHFNHVGSSNFQPLPPPPTEVRSAGYDSWCLEHSFHYGSCGIVFESNDIQRTFDIALLVRLPHSAKHSWPFRRNTDRIRD